MAQGRRKHSPAFKARVALGGRRQWPNWPSGVGNQQKWHTLRPERSGVGLGSCKLPEGPVVLSSPFDSLSLHLLPAS